MRARFCGFAESREVHGEHRGAAGERTHVVAPRLGKAAETMVMGTYVEILERSELKCRYQAAPKKTPTIALLARI